MTNDIEGKVRILLKEYKEKIKLMYHHINPRPFTKEDDDLATDAFLKLANLPKDFCDVCWTSSWMTVPKDTPNAQQVKGKDEWVLCQMCEAGRKIIKLITKVELNEKEVEKVLSKLAIEENSVRHSTDIMLASVINKVIHAICSHFSKPIKYPEKIQEYEPPTFTSSANRLPEDYVNGYNNAISDMRKLNEEA